MHTKSKVLVGSIKKGNSSTINLTVELFPIYAFELFPICAIRTIYTIPLVSQSKRDSQCNFVSLCKLDSHCNSSVILTILSFYNGQSL